MAGGALGHRLTATAGVIAVLLISAVSLHAASPARHGRSASIGLADASGAVSISDSKQGGAIFRILNLAPGGSGEGEVTIANIGSASGTLSLSSFDRSDSPGTYGGALSGQLELLLSDITGSAGKTVYAGALTAMPELDLGVLAGGEARTYRFLATMRDGGAPASPFVGDNLYQRATMSIGYQWTLTETEAGEPPSEPPAPPSEPPAAPSQPPAPPSPQPIPPKLVGTSGPDRLIGTSKADVIYGLGGADLIRGLSGDDELFGGAGTDRIDGGRGADLIVGGSGNDRLKGGAGRDRIRGGRGSDVIMARDGAPDVIDCGGGRDKAYVDATDRASNCEQVLGPHGGKQA